MLRGYASEVQLSLSSVSNRELGNGVRIGAQEVKFEKVLDAEVPLSPSNGSKHELWAGVTHGPPSVHEDAFCQGGEL